MPFGLTFLRVLDLELMAVSKGTESVVGSSISIMGGCCLDLDESRFSFKDKDSNFSILF